MNIREPITLKRICKIKATNARGKLLALFAVVPNRTACGNARHKPSCALFKTVERCPYQVGQTVCLQSSVAGGGCARNVPRGMKVSSSSVINRIRRHGSTISSRRPETSDEMLAHPPKRNVKRAWLTTVGGGENRRHRRRVTHRVVGRPNWWYERR